MVNSQVMKEVLAQYPKSLSDILIEELEHGEALVLEPWTIANRAGVSREKALSSLEALADHGFLIPDRKLSCSVCKVSLAIADIVDDKCPNCDIPLVDHPLEKSKIFIRLGERRYDLKWVVTIHGMNTRGQWQQEFAWNLSKVYRYSIPVFVYKYGRLLLSPLLTLRQKRYVNILREELHQRIHEMGNAGYDPRPTVIAHSFGTWLIAHALEADPELRVGRVVLTGSIVSPNFDWHRLMRNDQVEAVLCHSAGRDLPVRLTAFFIPDSGPSGVRGFNDRENILHAHSSKFGHSHFFRTSILSRNVDYPWGDFLTCQVPAEWILNDSYCSPDRQLWTRSPIHFVGHFLKHLVLSLTLLVAAFLIVAMIIGSIDLVSLLRSLCKGV